MSIPAIRKPESTKNKSTPLQLRRARACKYASTVPGLGCNCEATSHDNTIRMAVPRMPSSPACLWDEWMRSGKFGFDWPWVSRDFLSESGNEMSHTLFSYTLRQDT